MGYLFSSESVSEDHPDKVADQIADTLVDHFWLMMRRDIVIYNHAAGCDYGGGSFRCI